MIRYTALYLLVLARRGYVKSRKYKDWKDAPVLLVAVMSVTSVLFIMNILELLGIKGLFYIVLMSREGTPWGAVWYPLSFIVSFTIFFFIKPLGPMERKARLRSICKKVNHVKPSHVKFFVISYFLVFSTVMFISMFILYDRYVGH